MGPNPCSSQIDLVDRLYIAVNDDSGANPSENIGADEAHGLLPLLVRFDPNEARDRF
jgi:hypothetical protein